MKDKVRWKQKKLIRRLLNVPLQSSSKIIIIKKTQCVQWR